MTLLPTLTAVEYEKELGSGATKPCVFQCEDSKSKPAGEYVVKLRGTVRSNEIGLQYELLAWYLAEHLGIPHPAAALVAIDEEVAATIERREVRENVQKSIGLNFGTKYQAGFSSWVAGARVPASMEHTAAEIVALARLQDLDYTTIEKICAAVPPQFGAVNGKIPAHLRAARDHAPAVMDVIQEIFK